MFSRQAAFTTIGLLALVGASSFLAVKSTVFQKNSHNPQLTTGVGFAVTNWNMSKSGQLMSIVKANKLIHYNDNNSDLFGVRGTYYNLKKPHNPPWHISARYGKLTQGDNLLTLTKDVVIVRHAAPGFKPIQMNTAKLIYDKSTNQAHSDVAVKFTQPDSRNVTTANGMKANFNTNDVKLLGDVQTTFLPRPKAKE